MDSKSTDRINNFKTLLTQLYDQISHWTPSALNLTRIPIILTEEFGSYEINSLQGKEEEHLIFWIKPVGINIIAAEARADVEGNFSSAILIYLGKEHFIESSISSEINGKMTLVSVHKEKIYSGYGSPGWYIAKDRAKVVKIDQQNFKELVEEVSGHTLSK